jgi:hypothetical protein
MEERERYVFAGDQSLEVWSDFGKDQNVLNFVLRLSMAALRPHVDPSASGIDRALISGMTLT